MKPKSGAGFTLIELLVVISIIGLLASIVLVSFGSARGKARDAKRLAERRQVITALELFYDTNNRYPTSANGGIAWSCLAPSSESCWRGVYQGLDSLVTDFTPYLRSFPKNNAPTGQYAKDRLLYITSMSLSGQTGVFLIWVQEKSMTQDQCPSAYPVQKHDDYWYCYEYIGPP